MPMHCCKMEIFVPEEAFEKVRAALASADAGHIGKYDCCLSVSRVTGYWRPLQGAKPYRGESGALSCEPELKIEVTVEQDLVSKTIEAVKAVHPYEEPVINVIDLVATGLG